MAFEGRIENFPEFASSRETLLSTARDRSWYHTLELDGSLTTPGEFDLRPYVPYYLPFDNLSRADCLDIGAGNGFWSFEMERKHARSVTAIDIADFSETDFSILCGRDELRPKGRGEPGAFGEQLRIAATLLRSRLIYRLRNVYDLHPERDGMYDLVHCGSMLMHLFGPLLALQRMASVCRDTFIITTQVDPSLEDRCAAAYLGHRIPYVHFVPSPSCLVNMIASCGYENVLQGPLFLLPFRDRAANPMLIPHMTCIAFKPASANAAGFCAPRRVEPQDQTVRITPQEVPDDVRCGAVFFARFRVENTSVAMWRADRGENELKLGCESGRLGRPRGGLAALSRHRNEVPLGHYLPPGTSTIVTLRLTAPERPGKLVLQPYVTQKNCRFRGEVSPATVRVRASPPTFRLPPLFSRLRQLVDRTEPAKLA